MCWNRILSLNKFKPDSRRLNPHFASPKRSNHILVCVQGGSCPRFLHLLFFIISSSLLCLLFLRPPVEASSKLEGAAEDLCPLQWQPPLLQHRVPLPLPRQFPGVPCRSADYHHHHNQGEDTNRWPLMWGPKGREQCSQKSVETLGVPKSLQK